MPNVGKNKIVLFLCSFGAVVVLALFAMSLERKQCMGVPLITEAELQNYSETTELDISQLMFEKNPVAVDWPKATAARSDTDNPPDQARACG